MVLRTAIDESLVVFPTFSLLVFEKEGIKFSLGLDDGEAIKAAAHGFEEESESSFEEERESDCWTSKRLIAGER